jgi:nitroreductase
MLIASTALSYGSMWRTGDPAYDDDVKAALGLTKEDAIVGFLYLGTPHEGGDTDPNEANLDDLVEWWQPSA